MYVPARLGLQVAAGISGFAAVLIANR